MGKNDKENKVSEKEIKKALKERTRIGSVEAIIIFVISSIIIGVILYLVYELFISIVRMLPTEAKVNVLTTLINIMSFKYFGIILSAIISFICSFVFTRIIKSKFIFVSTKSDFLQKFIVLTLTIAVIGVFINLKNGQKKLHTQFLTLQVLETNDVNTIENNPELYERYHKDDENKLTNVNQVKDYYLQRFDDAAYYYLIKDNEFLIINTFVSIAIMIVCVILTDRKKDKE